jgi:hypothetical protein
MAYSDFTLRKAKEDLNLTFQEGNHNTDTNGNPFQALYPELSCFDTKDSYLSRGEIHYFYILPPC